MNTEAGMEALINRIESDAQAALAADRALLEKKLAALAEEQKAVLSAIDRTAREHAEKLAEKERQRGCSAAHAAFRAILSEKKSALVREAFSRAIQRFSSMDEKEYVSLMAPMLSSAAAEFPKGTALTLIVPEKAPVSGEALVQAADIRVCVIRTSEKVASGFLLCSDTLEIDCTPEKLIDDRYEALSPKVAAILFEKDTVI